MLLSWRSSHWTVVSSSAMRFSLPLLGQW